MVGEIMRPGSPDFHDPRHIVAVVLLVVFVPAMLVTLVLLVRRRRMYPIAGRGASLLIMYNVNSLVAVLLPAIVSLSYPEGAPCAMTAGMVWLSMGWTIGSMARGWQLVFRSDDRGGRRSRRTRLGDKHRAHSLGKAGALTLADALLWRCDDRLEIMNYLAELSWREKQIQQIHEMEAEEEEARQDALADELADESPSGGTAEAAAETGDAVTVGTSSASGVEPDVVVPICRLGAGAASSTPGAPSSSSSCSSLPLPSLDPSSIPGNWYIMHRSYTGIPWVTRASIACLLFVCCIIALSLEAQWDSDISRTNDWLVDHGYPREDRSSSYLHMAFFHGPRCVFPTSKLATWVAWMGVVLPVLLWTGWHLRTNSQRMQKRAQEQNAWEANRRIRMGEAQLFSPMSSSASAPPPPPHVSVSSDVDELSAVITEFLRLFTIGLLSSSLTAVLIGVAYAWEGVWLMLTFAALWATSIPPALAVSYRMTRKHRDMLRHARRKGSLSGGSTAGAGKFVADIPHHRSYFRLHFIITDPYTYPILLAFLQKEYSSENALFYRAAQEFARYCKELERTIPHWSSRMDGDEEGNSQEPASGIETHNESRTAAAAGLGAKYTVVPIATHAPLVGGSIVEVVSVSAAATGQSVSGRALAPIVETAAASPPPPSGAAPPLPRVGSLLHPPQPLALAQPQPQPPPQPRQRSPSVFLTVAPALSASTSTSNASTSSDCSSGGGGGSGCHGGGVAMATLPAQSNNPSVRAISDGTTAAQMQGHKRRPSVADKAVVTAACSSSSSSVAATCAQQAATLAAPLAHPAVLPSIRAMHERACRAREWALKLHADYLQPNAVYEVNIANDLAKLLQSQVRELEKWIPTPLDTAGEPDFERAALESIPPPPPPFPLSSLYKQTALSIFGLIESDSFRRFLLTSDFQLLLQRADDVEIARLQNQTDAAAHLHSMLAKADAVFQAGGGSAAPAPAAAARGSRSVAPVPVELNDTDASFKRRGGPLPGAVPPSQQQPEEPALPAGPAALTASASDSAAALRAAIITPPPRLSILVSGAHGRGVVGGGGGGTHSLSRAGSVSSHHLGPGQQPLTAPLSASGLSPLPPASASAAPHGHGRRPSVSVQYFSRTCLDDNKPTAQDAH